MEEEDIENCITKVNAVDNGINIYAQNMNQKMENLKKVKKKYLDALVDFKVFLGDLPSKEEKEKKFKEVENVARDYQNAVKSLINLDAGTKKFVDTIDKENDELHNMVNNYKSTLKDIEKYIKNNPKKKDIKKEKKKEEPKKEEPKKEEPKKEEQKKEEPKKEEPKKEEPKKEEPKKEEPKKEEVKKEEVKKEETKKEETEKEEPKKVEPEKEEPKKEEKPKVAPPKGDVRFMSNVPLHLGSILPQEPSYVANNPERKEDLLIGFKTGSCSLAQLKGNQLAVSQEFPLELGHIKSILVCQGKLCNGCYLVCTEQKKTILMVYPTMEKGTLAMNQMTLTKMEEENPSLIDAGGEGKVYLTQFNSQDLCAYCKNCIFIWKESNNKFELHKVVLDHDIDSLVQIGKNDILVLFAKKNKFVDINLTTLDKKTIDISDKFKISLRDDSNLIQINTEYFLIDNGIKYDIFKFDGELKYIRSIGKTVSLVEGYRKINDNTVVICEYFDGKRWFSKYKLVIKEGEVNFEHEGGPYMFDASQRLQGFCCLGDEFLVAIEKGSKKIYIFKI